MRLLIAMANMTAQYASGAPIFNHLRHAVQSDQPTSSSNAKGVFTAKAPEEVPHAEMVPLAKNVGRVPVLFAYRDILQPVEESRRGHGHLGKCRLSERKAEAGPDHPARDGGRR